MLSNLLHANFFYIYLVPLLVHRIGNLIAYVAALFLASDGKLASAVFFTFSDLFYRAFLLLQGFLISFLSLLLPWFG